MRRMTLWTTGLLLILLGAWGGIVSYVGPWFNYSMGGQSGWRWTTANWELHLVPGAAVVVGGLLILTAATVGGARLGSWLALLGGGWLIVGPLFASMWLGSFDAEARTASSTLAQAARPLGYHYGTGLLIVALAAYALGRGALLVRDWAYEDRAGTHRHLAPGTATGEPAGHVVRTD